MHRDPETGFYVQDHAGESVPASMANAMELQRRLAMATRRLLPESQWAEAIRKNETKQPAWK